MVSPPQVQSQDWWRIESDRFVIYTDVQQSDALSLAEHLSSLHELAPHFLPDSPEDEAHHSTPRRDLELLVFARRRDFARLLDPQFFAAFTQPGLDSTLLMVAPSGNKDTLYANLRHEYAH